MATASSTSRVRLGALSEEARLTLTEAAWGVSSCLVEREG
jgi:hypothetical protein